MIPLYEKHGFVAWSEREIRLRESMRNHFVAELSDALAQTNQAWKMIQVETPVVLPKELINPNYTKDDVWEVGSEVYDQLVLRPETTPGTYLMAEWYLKHNLIRPPFCLWQMGKSFRRESSDMSYGHMRLNEFYQLEFQCLYTADSKNDYHAAILPSVQKMIQEMVSKECRTIASDRLPSYSEVTMDIEALLPLKWLELCSVSRRTDFLGKYNNKDMKVVEVAIGIDRCVHAFGKHE